MLLQQLGGILDFIPPSCRQLGGIMGSMLLQQLLLMLLTTILNPV